MFKKPNDSSGDLSLPSIIVRNSSATCVPAYKRLIPTLNEPHNSWNPKKWEWDSSRFVAKSLDMMEISKEQQQQQHHHQTAVNPPNPDGSKKSPVGKRKEDECLLLKLGGSEEAATRPSKRVRSGSPGSGCVGNYPMCQVDNCKEDLSTAKDYHRRHKVCEVHSKAGKALVGKQMQRFCQQCSRLVNSTIHHFLFLETFALND
uniref:SBP-type domain-containing protein n=1 Tax=Lactuca sativa TaxID=4236 RepID=A0A9R1VBZ1_LACSA|nr:hypothetical protein LSAT_V11C500292070 [Lactuca sativa]